MRSIQVVGLACVLVLFIGACKPDAAEKPGIADTAKTVPAEKKSDGMFGGIFSDEPKAPALDLGEFKLLEVNLGTALDSDNLVANPKMQFGTKDKIFASVLSAGRHQGLSIKAKWTAPDGTLVAETEQQLVPANGTVSTFSISHDKPWPVGAYTLDIMLNDVVQRTVSFEVK